MNNNNNRFAESHRIGNIGEERFKAAYENHPKWKIVEVTQNPEYQQKEIDFIIEHRERGHQVTVELKTDSYSGTGNIFAETWSWVGYKKGWLETTQAQYIAYHFINGLEGYQYDTFILDVARLNNLNRAPYRRHTTYSKKPTGEGYKPVEGLLIPVKELEQLGIITGYMNLRPAGATHIKNSRQDMQTK